MGKLLEQRNRALDDINAGRTVKKIRDLESRVRELEEENARLKAAVEYAETIRVENIAYFEKQLATSQLRETQLRKALEAVIKVHGYESGIPVEALSQPSDTSSLDSFVAEKVKEIIESHAPEGRNVTNAQHVEMRQKFFDQIATLTRQRDLAVEALEDVRKELQQSNDRLNEEREIWDRVMGDGVKKLERLDLELDDCLYVLESLWDKTCNKEVTEKWAGILIRNKRGIGASSAEDSSEQTTA